MTEKISIIQFLPYFPPHKWWLETVAEELSSFYVSKWYGEVINVVFSVWQEKWIKEYKKNWYKVYILPAFDIIPNFPVPKFWKKEFWKVLKIPLSQLFPQREKEVRYIIQTHTRFFLSSFIWWLFAKYHKLKWVHIEHWSDYVKLGSIFKSKISYIYDRIIWKWIFKKADKLVWVSNACKEFIQKEFVNRKVEVIYRWLDFSEDKISYQVENNIKNKFSDKIIIWFVGRIVKLKWVYLLIEAFKNLEKKYPNIILEIVWDWDERRKLELIKSDKINFLWFQNREYIKDFLSKTDILVNPSYQEWLPTTVLEWLLSWCVVVATNVWWTKEISNLDDLILVNSWDLESLEKGVEKAILNYKDLRLKSIYLVRKKFDWNENIEKYFNLYKNL